MNFESLLSEMFSKVIFQLYKEYDYICYLYKIKLTKPMITIEDLSSEWGSWNPTFKTIRLSRKLITDYPWHVVIQVLKHEMAHQIVTQQYQSDSGHDQLFQQACETIAVLPKFRKAKLNLDDLAAKEDFPNLNSEDQVMLRKVEKLLNLAQSANEHEAYLAMQKVQEIYQKYNIENIQKKNNEHYESLFINFNKKVLPSTYQFIFALIQNHFFVNIIYGEMYDYLNQESYKSVEIIGKKSNIKMAEYVFYFLKDKIEKLWIEYQKNGNISAKYKLSFQKGVIEGFHSKLDKQIKKTEQNIKKNVDSEEVNLPMLLKEEQTYLNNYTKKLYPKLSTKSSSSGSVYSDFYSDGKTAGKKIILNKPIAEEKSGVSYLPGKI